MTTTKKTAAPAKPLTGKAKAAYDKRVAAQTKPSAKKAPAKKALPMPEGFTVGMKVKSSRDDLTYEVAGPDRSSSYVILRNADGKRLVRATKTLTEVKARARKPAAKKA